MHNKYLKDSSVPKLSKQPTEPVELSSEKEPLYETAQNFRQVLIIGCGLLGTSLGLALSEHGYQVFLDDSSPAALSLAIDMGAGKAIPANKVAISQSDSGTEPIIDASLVPGIHTPGQPSIFSPGLVVVATPPDVTGKCIINALQHYPKALVTDVASVKQAILTQVLSAQELSQTAKRRYLGSHPMAGRERSGAAFARSDLFYAHPWVIVPHDLQAQKESLYQLRLLATTVGAIPLELEAHEHDKAVALVSHVPQLISSLLASRLVKAPEESLALAGQGLRDTTRIAGSDPRLWGAIISGNAQPIAKILQEFQADLDRLLTVLTQEDGTEITPEQEAKFSLLPGVVGAVSKTVHQGNLGVGRIPGKHGGAPKLYREMLVVIPDRPGSLAKLFNDVGQAQVNIEDLKIEHSPGAAAGIAVLLIDPTRAEELENILKLKGWKITC